MPFYTRRNVNRYPLGRRGVQKETLDTIRKYNGLDLELCKYAQSLVWENVRRQEHPFRSGRAYSS